MKQKTKLYTQQNNSPNQESGPQLLNRQKYFAHCVLTNIF